MSGDSWPRWRIVELWARAYALMLASVAAIVAMFWAIVQERAGLCWIYLGVSALLCRLLWSAVNDKMDYLRSKGRM